MSLIYIFTRQPREIKQCHHQVTKYHYKGTVTFICLQVFFQNPSSAKHLSQIMTRTQSDLYHRMTGTGLYLRSDEFCMLPSSISRPECTWVPPFISVSPAANMHLFICNHGRSLSWLDYTDTVWKAISFISIFHNFGVSMQKHENHLNLINTFILIHLYQNLRKKISPQYMAKYHDMSFI